MRVQPYTPDYIATSSEAARSRSIWLLIDSSTIGGIERHVETLGVSLKEQGLRPLVVLLADHGANPWLRQLEVAGVRFECLDGSLLGLLRSLRRTRPALVHTHGYKANILGRMAASLARIPVVSSFHSGESPPYPVKAYLAADRWTSWLAPRIAVSRQIQDGLPFTSRLIQNFVRPPKGIAIDSGLPRRVVFVGRLSIEKGPDLFCRICATLPDGIEYVVYGDGPMMHELAAKYGRKVRFAGLTTDMSAVWREAGLLVMSSRAEGLPMAALEALAHGVPIAASRVGDLASVVVPGRTGWLFAPNDIDAARRAIEEWAQMTAREQVALRQACLQHVGENFSQERLVGDILDVYAAAGMSIR